MLAELLAKERLVEEMRLVLSDEKRSQTDQERLLEARLNEFESLSGGDGTFFALKDHFNVLNFFLFCMT